MNDELLSICWWCKHRHSAAMRKTLWQTCDAFPDGIPQEILNYEFDHRTPHPNDHGIQFEKYEDEQTLHRYIREDGRASPEEHLELAFRALDENRAKGEALPPSIRPHWKGKRPTKRCLKDFSTRKESIVKRNPIRPMKKGNTMLGLSLLYLFSGA